MNSRQSRRKKSHVGGFIRGLITVVIILAVLLGAGLFLERYLVQQGSNHVVSSLATKNSSVQTSGGDVTAESSAVAKVVATATSPESLAQTLNNYASEIKEKSEGLIDSAKATVTGSTVTYTVTSSKINGLTAAALVAANGDQMKALADKALSAMSTNGTKDPKMVVKLTNGSGETVKTLTYSD